MSSGLKCAYCQKLVAVSAKGFPRPHKNGAVNCLGAGLHRAIHEMLNASHPPPPAPQPRRK